MQASEAGGPTRRQGRPTFGSLNRLTFNILTCNMEHFELWPACLPASLPASLPPCLPACLCSGQFAEVLNLVPWGGVSLQFRHLRLFGMQGVSGLGESPLSSCCIPLRCTTRAGGQAAHCWGRADVMHAFYLCLQAPRWHLPMWRTLPDFRHTAL